MGYVSASYDLDTFFLTIKNISHMVPISTVGYQMAEARSKRDMVQLHHMYSHHSPENSGVGDLHLHPWKQTAGIWKSPVWKRKTSSKPFMFGFHVKFRRCTLWFGPGVASQVPGKFLLITDRHSHFDTSQVATTTTTLSIVAGQNLRRLAKIWWMIWHDVKTLMDDTPPKTNTSPGKRWLE